MNLAVPALILGKGTKWFSVSPTICFVVALAFPISYFAFDFFRRREINLISILGFSGTLLTGGIGLMALSPFWVAAKEAAVPALIAVALLVSRKLGNKFLFNEKIFDVPAIESAARSRGKEAVLTRALKLSTWLLFASFLLSAILNFVLARWIVVTEPSENFEQFNAELAKMFALSWPVIVVPCMIFCFVALVILFRGIRESSGLVPEEFLKMQKK